MFKIKSKKMAVHKKYNNGTKSNALGRGLDALISTEGVRTQGSSTINEIPLDQIEANPNQPRREFDDEALHELAESIKAIGIIQPITLRQVSENRFQIIAGERRWRASQLAGLTAIPAYIRTISDENVMEMALVENIQRQDLNAIEIALAYEHLLENVGMTQEENFRTCGQEPCSYRQLSATAQTSCPGADGTTEERNRHGSLPCSTGPRLTFAANQVVQGDTEERLLSKKG